MQPDHPHETDIFARIAVQRLSDRHQRLAEPGPAPAPDVDLPVRRRGRAVDWPAPPAITSAAELLAELDRSLKRHQPFLRELAPELESTRLRKPVRRFDWRVESAQDRTDFASTLAGAGDWQRVTVPHFGPPLGRAVTFYRTTVKLIRRMLDRGALFLCFRGVDYACQVYLNGVCLGRHEGFFAPFEFDCTAHARVGDNTLLVRVENDAPMMDHGGGVGHCGDKIYAASGPGYDDPELGWHHCPPGMGIYQEVAFEARPRLFVSDAWVRTLDLGDGAGAPATVEAWLEITNCDLDVKPVELELSVFGRNFRRTAVRGRRVVPHSTQIRGHGDVDQFNVPSVRQHMGPGVNYLRIPLEIPAARVWEPDRPWLYQLQLRLLDGGGREVDTAAETFGIRTFAQDERSEPKGRFLLNGREIRLRGANTMGHLQQCVLQGKPQQLIEDILLAKLCHMNFLRLTQRPVQKEIYAMCDRLGLMTQTDLPLFGVLRRNQMIEAVRQSGEMERLVRPHACNVVVSYINEPYPNATGQPHRHLVREELDVFFEMATRAVRQQNPDRVVKCCDGDYDPPAPFGMPDNHCYCGWYIGHALDLGRLHHGHWLGVQDGWFHGCGEFGAEALDPVNVMRKYYPREWLPPRARPDARWSPAAIKGAQSWNFHFLWYPTPSTMQEWVDASHDHQAWILRLMTEAFRRDARMNTFAVHLFIDAWPAGWMKTIMDVDRQPKKAYFAYRDALTPLMASLRGDRSAFHAGEPIPLEAWVCNDTHDQPAGAELRYRLETDGKLLQSGRHRAIVPQCSSAAQGTIRFQAPEVRGRTRVTARLALVAGDRTLHESRLELDVFPPPPGPPATGGPVRIVGARDGKAARLARALGCRCRFNGPPGDAQVILIDDPAALDKRRREVEAAVRAGATAVVLELPPGTHRLGPGSLTVVEGGMGKRHFAGCDTGHPLVDGFRRDDFRFWFDEAAGHVTPLLETVIESADGWSTVLTSGNGNWHGDWHAVPAAVDCPHGRGTWRVCQVKLADRLHTNPAARIFAGRLVSPSPSHPDKQMK